MSEILCWPDHGVRRLEKDDVYWLGFSRIDYIRRIFAGVEVSSNYSGGGLDVIGAIMANRVAMERWRPIGARSPCCGLRWLSTFFAIESNYKTRSKSIRH